MMEERESEERRELRLKSVAGAPDMVYPWPLTVGKGSVKKGEDEHDQAVEILDTIRWVCEEHPELRSMMGELLHSYNKTSWESMHRSGHTLLWILFCTEIYLNFPGSLPLSTNPSVGY